MPHAIDDGDEDGVNSVEQHVGLSLNGVVGIVIEVSSVVYDGADNDDVDGYIGVWDDAALVLIVVTLVSHVANGDDNDIIGISCVEECENEDGDDW